MPLQKANSSKCLQKTTSMRWESNRSSSILGELGTRKLKNTMTGNRIEKIPDSHWFRKWSTLLYNQWIRSWTWIHIRSVVLQPIYIYIYISLHIFCTSSSFHSKNMISFSLQTSRCSSCIGSWYWRCIQQNPMYWVLITTCWQLSLGLQDPSEIVFWAGF